MKSPNCNSTDCNDLVEQILNLMFQLKHRLQRVAESYDLTIVQAHVLMRLTSDNPCTMRDLADFFMTDASTITGLVDRMVKRGLVERQSHPTDRRKIHLVLTDDGYKLRQNLITETKGAESQRIAKLLTAEERNNLRVALQRLSYTSYE